PVPVGEAFRPGTTPWCDLGKPLEGVYIDVGENGLFSSDEFETVTALGQMEFITPEEVAEYVALELEGRPTGRDIVAALDGATAGPTYRAGVLRAHALDRLRELERQSQTRTVAREMVAQAERRRSRTADSGSDVDWTALGADDPIEPARFATWVFRYEDRGERIKR